MSYDAATRHTDHLPGDYKTREGFRMLTLSARLKAGGRVVINPEPMQVRCQGVRPADGCDFCAGGSSLSSANVYGDGINPAEVLPVSPWFGGDEFRAHLYCAEGDEKAATAYLASVLKASRAAHLEKLRESVAQWEACDV